MPTTPDPLVSASERFALGRSRFAPVDAGDPASPVRPLGLRFVPGPIPAVGLDPVDWSLCPDRQIALAADGTPWYRTVYAMTMKTTGPSTDGGPSTGGEEYNPDYHGGDRDEPG